MLGITKRMLPGGGSTAPTMAELRLTWAWCVQYFRVNVQKAKSLHSTHKFVFPGYKEGK
jgi:hypothetical protein